MMMKLGYVITYVDDVKAAMSFFTQAFGFEVKFLHEAGDYGELSTGETTLAFAYAELGLANLPAGFQRLNEMRKPAGMEIALVTDDVAQAVENAVKYGARVLAPAETKTWGQTVAYVHSPDGILIELCTPIVPEKTIPLVTLNA